MWKALTSRTEQELCAELNRLGVTEAQILCRGSTVIAVYQDQEQAPKKEKTLKTPRKGD
tara:strand:- start:219 stop:395 length:177 start_codon:yes stop_codon:yes gene_type:complete